MGLDSQRIAAVWLFSCASTDHARFISIIIGHSCIHSDLGRPKANEQFKIFFHSSCGCVTDGGSGTDGASPESALSSSVTYGTLQESVRLRPEHELL